MQSFRLSVISRNILFFIFALSGFSGLIYELIWTNYLKLFLGHAGVNLMRIDMLNDKQWIPFGLK